MDPLTTRTLEILEQVPPGSLSWEEAKAAARAIMRAEMEKFSRDPAAFVKAVYPDLFKESVDIRRFTEKFFAETGR